MIVAVENDSNSASPKLEELLEASKKGKVNRRELLAKGTALGVGLAGIRALSAHGAAAGPLNRLKLANMLGQDLADDQTVRLPEQEPTSMDPGVTGGGAGLEQL